MKEAAMISEPTLEKPRYAIKQPKNLSPRIQWLRDYYFQGVQAQVEQRVHLLDHRHALGFPVQRADLLHRPGDLLLPAHLPLRVPADGPHQWSCTRDFWEWSIAERRAWFVKEVMLRYLPQ